MNEMQAISIRHSVRQFTDQPIEEGVLQELRQEIEAINEESGLSFRLFSNEPTAFDGFLARFGKFQKARNYFALIGKRTEDLEERVGYYGERLVLKAVCLGLGTCWVGLTYQQKALRNLPLQDEEKLVLVIAFGYSANPGKPHKSKPLEKLSNLSPSSPDWFRDGVIAASLAPTAINQQKFYIEYHDGEARITDKGGPFSQVDLGIAAYHFEVGAKRKIQR